MSIDEEELDRDMEGEIDGEGKGEATGDTNGEEDEGFKLFSSLSFCNL